MKKLLILSMAGMLMLSYGCNRDEQDIQREEEINRGDMIEDSTYDQSDLGTGTGASPSDLDTDPDPIESQESDLGTDVGTGASETTEQ